ncbi:hypothetical protein SESBI_34044 [Sesbania bispinosa]|nr:hypothetical protein SESBI_34044 [Sesbania bispinosa]
MSVKEDSFKKRKTHKGKRTPTITFSNEGYGDINRVHDDPMVIRAIIRNADVRCVLIDQGSFADVVYGDCFKLMEYSRGDGGKKAVNTKFLVIPTITSYNAILGRPTLNALGAVVFNDHLVMKFPSSDGYIVSVRSNQVEARSCCNVSLQLRQEALVVGSTKRRRVEDIPSSMLMVQR